MYDLNEFRPGVNPHLSKYPAEIGREGGGGVEGITVWTILDIPLSVILMYGHHLSSR